MPHAGGEQQAGLKSTSSAAAFSTKRRRQSAGGRRRSKGGSSDFSYSPYQPMVIETTSSSVSPRPRRASAPIPPASLLLHKSLMNGERQGTDGPTLEQCLVLPPGLALKADGLLTQPLSKLGEGSKSRGGSSGGGGDGLDEAASDEGVGDGPQVEHEGGLRADDERAIISTYTFERSNSQAAATTEEEVKHVLAADEHDTVGDAVAVSGDGRSDTCDGGEEEGSLTPAEATLGSAEARSSAGPSAPREGIDDETAGARAATAMTVAGGEPPVSAAEEPDVPGSSAGRAQRASALAGDGEASDDDAVMVDLPAEVGFVSDGIDSYGPASPTAGALKPETALVDADAAAEGSPEARREEESVLPAAVDAGPRSRDDPAACSRETVETNDTSSALEVEEALEVDRVGPVSSGRGVEAPSKGGDDDKNDGHGSEEQPAEEETEAVLVCHEGSGTARAESVEGKKVGCIHEEDSSTSAATEASEASGDVSSEEEGERAEPRARDGEVLGVAVASVPGAATTTISNDSDAAGKTHEETEAVETSGEGVGPHETRDFQETVREGAGASGAIFGGEANATVPSYPSTAEKKTNAAGEEEKDTAYLPSLQKQIPVAAEPAASFPSFAAEVEADAAPTPPVEQLESDVAEAAAQDGALSPAVDAHSSKVTDVAVSSVAEDNGGVTAHNVAFQREEEFPLDWEALAHEVEAEWVMEGSDGESNDSLSPASPTASPPPPPMAEEVPPPYHVAVDVVETSAASPVGQHKEEGVDMETSRDDEEPRESTSDNVPESPSPAAATQSHRWEDGSTTGGGGGCGLIAGVLEDSKEEADAYSHYWDGKKQAADDSDCGSVLPASCSEEEFPIPTSEAPASTLATTRDSGGLQQSSASITSPARVDLPAAQTPVIGQTKDGAARSAALANSSPAAIRPPMHGSGVAEQVEGGRGNQNVTSAEPVSTQATDKTPPARSDHDGGSGVSQALHKERVPEEVGRGGGGCAASCGCVVM
eukprot:g7860.t1